MSLPVKCEACPVPPGGPCGGQIETHAVFCEWVRAWGSDAAGHVRTVSAALAGDAALVTASAQPPAPKWKHERFGRAWLDRINTCPYRECRTGCQRSRCHAGRGDDWGQTTLENCRSCLRGTPGA